MPESPLPTSPAAESLPEWTPPPPMRPATPESPPSKSTGLALGLATCALVLAIMAVRTYN